MTGPSEPAEPTEPGEPREAVRRRDAEVERRRRRARVFGDLLPETTSDDREDREDTGDRSEEWLRRQVPPHHGSS